MVWDRQAGIHARDGRPTRAGFGRSYPTLVRELRQLELRPVCVVCQQRRGRAPTTEIDHPPGEEIQLDWLELPDTLWGEPAHVLAGALSHLGRFRAVFFEQMTFGHLAGALHEIFAGLGRTPRIWRTDPADGLPAMRRPRCRHPRPPTSELG